MIHRMKNVKLKIALLVSSYVLFTLYVLLLIYLLFFGFYRQSVTVQDYNLIPFKTIRMYITHASKFNSGILFNNLAGNVLAFMPLGFFLPLICKKNYTRIKILLTSFTVSLLVECIQLYFRIGGFDVDDILLNTIGGLGGFLILKLGLYGKKRFF